MAVCGLGRTQHHCFLAAWLPIGHNIKPKPESALEGSTHELLRPSSLDVPKAEPQQASQPDWVVVESDGLIMAEPESEEAEALRKKQEAQQLKEKKKNAPRERGARASRR